MDANTTIRPVRFVRCPNCRNVLREIPEIPVYKCGGCGIILKAKHHVTTLDGVTSSTSLGNDIQNVSNPNSLDTTDKQEKEKDSDSQENDEEKRLEEKIQSLDENTEKIQSLDENTEKIQSLDENTEKIQSVDEKTEKLTQPSPVSYISSKSSENAYITIENDTKFAPESPCSYYAGSSSFDSKHEKTAPNKNPLMSRRTFRQKKILDSEKDSEETKPKMQSQTLPEVKNELPAFIHSIERDNTFDSEDYHSVQNWNASDSNEVTTKPQSKSFRLQNSEPDHMKILRKVDELRDDLSEYLAKTVEEKKDIIQKQNFKPKTVSSVTKSYCRPVYNGAPFVVCYKCRKLLQLPADFLVTRKRYHKLKCGSCSQVLLFSFRPRDYQHGATSTEEALHPPSEIESSVSSSYNSRAEKKLNVSRNSSCSVRQSRLHRLMGYSSATELLFAPQQVNDGYESTEPGTPRFFRPQGSVEIEEEEEEEEEGNERLRSRRRGSALKGFLKKGVQKLKIHSNV